MNDRPIERTPLMTFRGLAVTAGARGLAVSVAAPSALAADGRALDTTQGNERIGHGIVFALRPLDL